MHSKKTIIKKKKSTTNLHSLTVSQEPRPRCSTCRSSAGGAQAVDGTLGLALSLCKHSPEHSRKMKDARSSGGIRKCEIRGRVAIFRSNLLTQGINVCRRRLKLPTFDPAACAAHRLIAEAAGRAAGLAPCFPCHKRALLATPSDH